MRLFHFPLLKFLQGAEEREVLTGVSMAFMVINGYVYSLNGRAFFANNFALPRGICRFLPTIWQDSPGLTDLGIVS